MPKDSTRSRSLVRLSTVQLASIFADGSELQMLFTPSEHKTSRMSSVDPCCVPTFIRPFRAAPPLDFCGRAVLLLITLAPAVAPASCRKFLRFMSVSFGEIVLVVVLVVAIRCKQN